MNVEDKRYCQKYLDILRYKVEEIIRTHTTKLRVFTQIGNHSISKIIILTLDAKQYPTMI